MGLLHVHQEADPWQLPFRQAHSWSQAAFLATPVLVPTLTHASDQECTGGLFGASATSWPCSKMTIAASAEAQGTVTQQLAAALTAGF